VKITVRPAAGTAIPAARIAQRIRSEALSSGSVRRLERELADELDMVSTFERSADADMRRDALERAVRRVWGAPL
jgi:hypothetical protein